MTRSAHILKQAKSLIANPQNWVMGAEAVDSYGFETCPINDDACSFCLIGALAAASWKVTNRRYHDGATQYLERAVSELQGGYDNIPHFNDSHRHDDVMTALDRAIELAS